jgi:tagaturonate reductase
VHDIEETSMTPDANEGRDRVLQFGTGRFLRGFVDAFLHEENLAKAPAGGAGRRSVTVVETSGSGSARRLAAQGCRYRLLVRGRDQGRVVDESRVIDVIDRSIDADHEPASLAEAALDPEVGIVVSNTTEAGYLSGRFPARLSTLLEARARAGLPGVTILPASSSRTTGAVARPRPRRCPSTTRAGRWSTRCSTRTCGGDARGPHHHGAATGDQAANGDRSPWSWNRMHRGSGGTPAEGLPHHPAVQRTADVLPFALRKIRILNGAHTALVVWTRDTPIALVREAMDDPDIASRLEDLLVEEVVPALGERVVDGSGYVHIVMERFRNPFQDHLLSDIGAGHSEKLAMRLVPTYHDYVARFGRPPRRLGALLAREGLAA